MSTMETPQTETPAEETFAKPETQPDQRDALIESLRKQNEDMAAALRQSTVARGFDPAPAPAAPTGPSLQQQLRQLDEDERYMHLSQSEKSAIAAKLLYAAEIAPQAAALQKQMAKNAVMLFKQVKGGEKDAAKIFPLFDQVLAPVDELAKLDADGLQNYLDGVWLQAVGMFYRNAQAAAPPPREEPFNLGGGSGHSAPLPGGPSTLTIDQIDERTVRLGRQMNWDDERIIKAAQRALEQGEA
jgi:hypothetical protein